MSFNVGLSPIVKDGLVLFLDPSSSVNYTLSEVEVLVVAGGGGGGANHAGGGGAGGLIYRNSHTVTPGTPITVTVGNGGATPASSTSPAASNGQNSVFGTLVAIGGGGGGNRNDADGTSPGRDGGSGGGGGGAQPQFAGNYTPGNGVSGQGFPGGRAVNIYGGGGGGAGGKGFDGIGATLLNSGNGGPGLLYNISGSPKYYAGGGGGGYGGNVGSGLGGVGGGGRGGIPAGDPGTPGESNTGGGGGGGGAGGQPGSSGGSGVVIVRYPGPQKATGGNTITQVGGYTIHTFTSSGTFTPLSVPSNGGTVYGLQDLSGNNRGGNVSGNPTYTSANNGTIAFSGVVGSYINLQEFPTITNQPISVFAFVYATDSTGSRGVWGYLRADGRNCHFETNNGQWRVRLADLNNSTITPVTLNTWQYVGFSYDGFNNSFYINGTLISTWSGSSGTMFGPVAAANLGNAVGDSNPVARPWQGNISNVQYYYKALTLTEIQQNFNALRGRFGV